MKEYPNILFYGTQDPNFNMITPFECVTSNLFYAIIHAGKELDLGKVSVVSYDGSKIILEENCLNGFKDTYDCTGYIYAIDAKYFNHVPSVNSCDLYHSDRLTPILGKMYINNLWNIIQNDPENYTLIYYKK